MGTAQRTALLLTIIGALNWALIGLFRFDIVAQAAGGSTEPIARLIYIIIGIAGLINIGLLFGEWREREHAKAQIPTP